MEMTNEELQKLLTSFEQEVGNIKQWEIDRKDNLKAVCKDGAQASLKSEKFLEVRSKGGKVIGKRNVESGHLASICSAGGKAGAKSQIEKGLGIHTDSETRREWARLGGLKTVTKLNIEKTCPYCGIITRGAAYNRWHGDKCKHKII